MIPFEEEASLNRTEKYVEGMLENKWDNVVRTTPGVLEDIKGRYPEVSEKVSQRISRDIEGETGNVFRSGVPDFMAFSDSGQYLFVEVKSDKDGLRHTQLKWLKDFKGINCEIWFTEHSKEVEDKLDSSELQAYSLREKKGDSDHKVEKTSEGFKVNLPDELAAITGLQEDDRIRWRLKSKDELVLDTR